MLKLLLAFSAGAIGVTGFAPLSFSLISIVSLAVLFNLWSGVKSPWRAWGLGMAFGLGLFGAGVSWVFVSLHVFGNMPILLAAFSVLGFVFYLSLFPAFAGYVVARFNPTLRDQMLLLFPPVWMLGDWLRSWLFSGFPWLSAGYSQTNTFLGGLASWLGVYGIGLAVAVSAGALVLLWRGGSHNRVTALITLFLIWGGSWLAGTSVWVQTSGDPVSVAIIQGNVPLARKWAPGQRRAVLQHYLNLSREQQVALQVWPEVAVPYYGDELDETFWRQLREHPSDFVIGLLERHLDRGGINLYNSVVAVTTNEKNWYRKQHLVPFGEYLPLAPVFGGLLKYLQIPMSNFSPWRGAQGPLPAAGVQIGVTICYEDAFPEELRTALPQAQLLLNVSEDAWFGDSLAPHQRLQMAQMRSMETQRPMLRAANTGISALIDRDGSILARAAHFRSEVLTGQVQPVRGATPYVRFGNTPFIVLCVLLLLSALWVRSRNMVRS